MKEIVNPENGIEKICSKCAWPPDAKIEKSVKEGKMKFIEFDQLYREINKQRTRMWRRLKKSQNTLIQKEERV
jgi:hypothetical protein